MGFDPYREWLKIPGDQRPPNHYELLGVSRFESDEKRLRVAYRQRYALVRKYTIGAREEEAARLIDELSEAHDCLSRLESREKYEREVREAIAVTGPAASGSAAATDAAVRDVAAPQTLTDTRGKSSDTLAGDQSAWPREEKTTPAERVPTPPPPPPEFTAAETSLSAPPPPPPAPSRFDSWHRLSAMEKWLVASVGVSGVAAVVVAVAVAVVAANGTGTEGSVDEVAKAGEVTSGNAATPPSNMSESPDDTEVVADSDESTATDSAAESNVTVPSEPSRGSSILDATDASIELEPAPNEDTDGGSTGPVTLPNADPGSAEIHVGTPSPPAPEPVGPTFAPGAGVVDDSGEPSLLSNIVDPVSEPPYEPSMEELIDALSGKRDTTEPELPVGLDAVVARRSPDEEPAAGGDSRGSMESVKLATDDGTQIHCTWYPSPKAAENGKEVVPVIVVHGWGEERSLYDGLARSLQSKGHAVIVPDLRGHGSSTVILTPVENRRLRVEVQGDTMKVAGKRQLPTDALTAMVRYDMEAVRDFLIAKNNAEELNIQLLSLVASEAGSIVALNWAANDWSWLQPAIMPQGGHVKAVALVSPAMVFKGVSLQKTLSNHIIRDRLAVTIIVGEEDTAANREARRLYMAFNRTRPTVPSRDRIRKQDLVLIDVKSSLQGARLLDVEAFGVNKKIASFIYMRVVNRSRTHPWEAR